MDYWILRPPPLEIHLSVSTVVSLHFNQRNAALIFLLADLARYGVADFLKAGEIPKVRELTAFLRFDRLDGTIFTFQKNTRAVRLFLERQSAPVLP